MSKFNIGDRVRVVEYPPDSDPFLGKAGTVVEIPNSKYIRVDLGRLGTPLFLAHELKLAPKPGPKPLTLTGGKARFTVRNGHRLLAQPRVLSAMRGDGASYTLFIRERS